MVSQTRGGIAAVALLAGAALACGDSAPTDPASEAAAPRLVVSAEAASAFHVALEDARLRVVPGLTSDALGLALAASLGAIDAAVSRRDARTLRGALADADAALAANGAPESPDSAELSALRLVLDHARLLAATDY